jgi:chlorite dismutase
MSEELHSSGKRPDQGKAARDLNQLIRYTMFSAFAVHSPLPADRGPLAQELAGLVEQWAAKDVVVRGWYDIAGMRADADLLLWTHGPSVDVLQGAYHDLRRSALGRCLRPTWSNTAMHQPAEFNKSHVPAFLAGEAPRRYLSLYPFVRSYEWYLLPEEERRALLLEHGMMGRSYPDVRANTVAAFALGDYEWLLAFEADELHRIVDLMRHLRGSGARRHVREEVPFFTGPRRPLGELLADLP